MGDAMETVVLVLNVLSGVGLCMFLLSYLLDAPVMGMSGLVLMIGGFFLVVSLK
jgi:hypothetical protein